MAKNMKFHVIAISIISVVIIILYMLIGPKPQPDHVDAKPTDRFVRIGSATWGMACNQQIEEAQHARDSIPLAKDKDGKVIQVERLKKVTADNVLTVVKKECEGQMTCAVLASDDALGVELLPGCFKQLNATYRCSDVDRLVSANIEQGQWLKIDCSPDASATTPQHP